MSQPNDSIAIIDFAEHDSYFTSRESTMEPITTGLVITGIVALAKKAAEGAATKGGELAVTKASDLWLKIKQMIGLQADLPPAALEPVVKAMVEAQAHAVPELARLLQEYEKQTGVNITQETVQVAGSGNVGKGSITNAGSNSGTINNTNTFN